MVPARCFVRALIVCAACLQVTAPLGAEAAAFPLVTTALTAHFGGTRPRLRSAAMLLTHLICAAGGYMVRQMHHSAALVNGYPALLLGATLMLALQATRLRHPPALASGGAVLCGVDPLAVAACAGVTAVVMTIEVLGWRFASGRDN